MKIKNKLVIILMIIMIGFTFTGCGKDNAHESEDNLLRLCYDNTENCMNVLMYNPDTRIVYIYNQYYQQGGLCPYISENGKYVKWIKNELVEVE